MADMLVKLYVLPPLAPILDRQQEHGVTIRPAHASEKNTVAEWVRYYFQGTWAAECRAAFEQRPVTCFIATERDREVQTSASPYDLSPERLLGFACYDVTARGMFGPEGVREDRRGQGIGKALLLASLYAMQAAGYAYVVIGWAGPVDFYARTVGATLIADSEPGIFTRRLIQPSYNVCTNT